MIGRSCWSSLVVLLVAAGSALSQAPVVRLPAEVQGEPGLPVLLAAQTDCAVVKWSKPRAGCGIIVFPGDGKNAYFFAQKPGRYWVRAWTAKGDVPSDEAICVVVVGDAPPVPPPTPPPGPGPTDPLVEKLKAAYAADATQDKVTLKGKLAALYRQAAGFAGDGQFPTWGELYDALGAAARTLGIAGKLAAVQGVLSQEIVGAVGTPSRDTKLADGDRSKLSDVFTRIAKALEAL